MGADLLISRQEHPDFVLARIGEGQRRPALDDSGLHVEYAWAAESVADSLEGNALQCATRPHGVEVPEEQDAGRVSPPAPHWPTHVDFRARGCGMPAREYADGLLHNVLAGFDVLAWRLDGDECLHGIDHRLLHRPGPIENIRHVLPPGKFCRMETRSAEQDLASAESRAAVEVRACQDLTELHDARWVCDEVWPSDAGSTQVPPNLVRAMVHAGGYASVAYRDGRPIGAGLGFIGRHEVDGSWHEHLHSHMVAVLEPYRDQHVGAAIKKHQRAWCLRQGIDTVVWTFDPLVRRNARLNLVKLGVDVEEFIIDFYGPLDDPINRDEPTDRLFAWWRLDSQRAQDAAANLLVPIDPASMSDRDTRVIELPLDIVAVRSEDPEAAARWRQRVRTQLVDAFDNGYRIIGVTPDDGYLLERST